MRGANRPPNYQKNKNKYIFNKHTITVCVSCSWLCPCTSVPSTPYLTACSSWGNIQDTVEGSSMGLQHLKKKLQGSQIETMDLLGRTGKNVFLTRGQWLTLLTNHWFFTCLASKILECLGLKHKSCNFVSWVRPCAAGGTLVQLSKKGVSLFYNYFQQKSLAGWGSRRQVTKHST